MNTLLIGLPELLDSIERGRPIRNTRGRGQVSDRELRDFSDAPDRRALPPSGTGAMTARELASLNSLRPVVLSGGVNSRGLYGDAGLEFQRGPLSGRATVSGDYGPGGLSLRELNALLRYGNLSARSRIPMDDPRNAETHLELNLPW